MSRYDEQKIAKMRIAADICSNIYQEVINAAKPGVTTLELDQLAESLCKKNNVIPAFKGFEGFPATLCISNNDVVVHGFPGDEVLKEGDLLGIDMGVKYKDVFSDMSMTIPVGGKYSSQGAEDFTNIVKKATLAGIAAAVPGNTVGDIGHAMQSVVEGAGYSVVREMVGHGIGYDLHEDPYIPGFGNPGEGETLYRGQTLAVEAIVNQGTKDIVIDADDGWTAYTQDGKLSGIFEHTIIVGSEPEILTRWSDLAK